jgi:hypothetical protein
LKKPDPKKQHKLSAEGWYQANKTNDLAKDKAMMQQIIEAKFKQYPELVKAVDDRGGVSWIENSEHKVTGRGRWEGVGRESNFLDVLANAYEAVSGVPREASQGPERRFTGSPKTIALIGTAGRKEDGRKLTKESWDQLLADAEQRVRPEDTLVSGGAAWADHIAVRLFLDGKVKGLKLFLPSEVAWDHGWFAGPPKSAASAAQYYHEQFSKVIGTNSIRDLLDAINKGAEVEYEPSSQGYKAMFDRNKKVAAAADSSLAYTFGPSKSRPKDGGTLDTWNQISGEQKIHVPIDGLTQKEEVPRETPQKETWRQGLEEFKWF